MKSKIIHILLVLLGIIIVVCLAIVIYCMTGSSANHGEKDIVKGNDGTKSIVVYFSRSNAMNYGETDTDTHASLNLRNSGIEGNTEITAKMIQQ